MNNLFNILAFSSLIFLVVVCRLAELAACLKLHDPDRQGQGWFSLKWILSNRAIFSFRDDRNVTDVTPF